MDNLLAIPLRWVAVAGGACLFGDAAKPRQVADLLVAVTPLTNAQAGLDGQADLPVTGVGYATACLLAAQAGGRIPTSVEWEWIAAGRQRRLYPWGDQPWQPRLAWLRGEGIEAPQGPCPVGGFPDGSSPDGVLDLAGNVWEWTASPVMGGGRVIRGGSFASHPLYARCTFLNAVHAERQSPGIGVRVVKTP